MDSCSVVETGDVNMTDLKDAEVSTQQSETSYFQILVFSRDDPDPLGCNFDGFLEHVCYRFIGRLIKGQISVQRSFDFGISKRCEILERNNLPSGTRFALVTYDRKRNVNFACSFPSDPSQYCSCIDPNAIGDIPLGESIVIVPHIGNEMILPVSDIQANAIASIRARSAKLSRQKSPLSRVQRPIRVAPRCRRNNNMNGSTSVVERTRALSQFQVEPKKRVNRIKMKKEKTVDAVVRTMRNNLGRFQTLGEKGKMDKSAASSTFDSSTASQLTPEDMLCTILDDFKFAPKAVLNSDKHSVVHSLSQDLENFKLA